MVKVKLVDVAVENIIAMIKQKEYDANGYLPSEGDLAESMEVSRSTIREAVRSLEVRGLVVRKHGKGVQVVDNSTEVVSRSLSDMILNQENILEELLEVRMVIEPVCVLKTTKRASKEDLKSLEGFVLIMEQDDISDDEYYKADLDFHVNIAKLSGNRIYESLVLAYTPIMMELIIAASPAGTRLEQVEHYHRRVLEAMKEQNFDLATHEMLLHLQATGDNWKNSDFSGSSNFSVSS